MHLHLKQTLSIFFIFFLWQSTFAQRTYQPANDISLSMEGTPLSMPWAGGLNAALFQAADLDGDGQEELIAFDRSSQAVLVFSRQNGNWQSKQELACPFPAGISNWLIMNDYDKDGRKDIFTYSSSGIRVFKNKASGEGSAVWELVEEYLSYEGNDRIVNLLVNSTDVPAIEDVDGDGDLDILTYDPSGGGGLEYYRNQSMERSGSPDQFLYTLESRRWGGLSECNCGEFAYNGEICKNKGEGHRVMHAGGKSLLLYDVDGDGDFDLLNGFEACKELFYLENKGSNTEPLFDEFATLLPGATEIPAVGFPAAFSVDADQDGEQDLVVSSQLSRNSSLQQDYSQSVWWFKPDGFAEHKTYSLQSKAFLQENMLDVGEWSVPTFADVDGDGDQDMLLGSYGQPEADDFYTGLRLFTNVGSPSEPAFELADQDYLQLKSMQLMQLQPQFIDFNQDGSQDLLLIATETESFRRKGFLFVNKAAANTSFNFQDAPLELSLPVNSQDNPFFFDMSGDGLPDLLVGKFDGSLSYYENQGTAEAPIFGSEVKSYMGLGLDNYRRPLVPSVGDLSGNGQSDLLLGDGSGHIRFVENLLAAKEGLAEPQDLLVCGGSPEVSWFGKKSWPVVVQLRANHAPAIVVGNLLGGVWVLYIDELLPVEGEGFQLKVYPNPVFQAEREAYVCTSAAASIRLISITGQVVRIFPVQANKETPLPLNGLPEGTYVVQAVSKAGKFSKRLLLLK